ncbi:MAG: nucleoside monophosphate kinase, partial [Oscillospiraceae bacterium]
KFKSYTDRGLLVPDELVVAMVSNRLNERDCQKGYILDGFPRTIRQAEEFGKMGGVVDCVLCFEVADEDVIKRMTGRRVCADCGTPYHIYGKPPKKENICDLCGGKLVSRVDDAPDTVLERLRIYHSETEPLTRFYKEKCKYFSIEATGTVEETTTKAKTALETL